MEDTYWFLLAFLYFSINISVTVFLFKRDDLDQFRKFAQSILSWAIPFIGAIVFWRINKSHDIQYKASTDFGGGSAKSGSYDSAGDGGSGD